MNKVRITAIRQTVYPDLMAKYENPIEHTGQTARYVTDLLRLQTMDEAHVQQCPAAGPAHSVAV